MSDHHHLAGSSQPEPFPLDAFGDVVDANCSFAAEFDALGLTGTARRGLAIVTCMDSRINPLAVVGMDFGDVKILRNAGARVTEDVLRTLVLATYLLGVKRVLVMPHTDCAMSNNDEATLHARIANEFGVDTRSLEFRTTAHPRDALISDVIRIRSFPLLPDNVVVAGAFYDVTTGLLTPVDC